MNVVILFKLDITANLHTYIKTQLTSRNSENANLHITRSTYTQ